MRTTTIFAEIHTSERANHVAYRLVNLRFTYLLTCRSENKENGTKPTPPSNSSDSMDRDRRPRRRDNSCTRCGHHHHTHQRRQRRGRAGTSCECDDDCAVDNSAGVCSNRMVQIAVIVLVLIMAVWWVTFYFISIHQVTALNLTQVLKGRMLRTG